jgi:hypothetical protein
MTMLRWWAIASAVCAFFLGTLLAAGL